MIILLIILFAALAVVGFFYVRPRAASWVVGVLSMVLLALSMIALAYHDTAHWGMRQVTTTTTRRIYTAGDRSAPYGVLIESPFGTNSDNAFLIYRRSQKADATMNFASTSFAVESDAARMNRKIKNYLSDHVVTMSKKSSRYKRVAADTTTARVTTKTVRWEFSSRFAKTLFSVGGEGGELVRERSTVAVPRDTWLVLTAAQANRLQTQAPKLQAQQAAKTQAAIAAAPTPEAKAAIAAQAQQEASQMAALEKSDPTAYAKLMVTQIKAALGIKD